MPSIRQSSPGRVLRRPAGRRGSGGFHRLLLVLGVAVLPLQDHLPAIAGFSVMYLAFALLGIVALVSHPRRLVRVAIHPIFITGYALVLVTLFVELLHSNPDLLWWSRMAQMIAGGVIVGSYIRSDREVHSVLTGFVLASMWVALLIVRSSYGVAASGGAAGFSEASELREVALAGLGLRANWNMLALLCASAAGIAAARALLATERVRIVYAVVTLIALMATFMTFSRSGILAAALALGYVFFALLNRRLVGRLFLFGGAVLLVIALAVPRVVFERFNFSLEYDASGNQDSRAHVYGTMLRTLPEYVLGGVGSGNYWSTWAVEHGLSINGESTGAHNTFLQVTAFWGVMGLIAWTVLCVVTWRVLRRVTRHHLEYVPLTAFCVTIALTQLVSHDIADKQLSVVLGTIAGLSDVRRQGATARRRSLERPRLQPEARSA